MRALKGLVIGMAVLIVVGMGLFAYAVANRADLAAPRPPARDPAAVAPEGARRPSFGEVTVPMPRGCEVVEMRPDGDLLYLRFGPSGVCGRVVIIDVATGAVLGTVVMEP